MQAINNKSSISQNHNRAIQTKGNTGEVVIVVYLDINEKIGVTFARLQGCSDICISQYTCEGHFDLQKSNKTDLENYV